MSSLVMFTALFFGVILLCAACYPVGKLLYACSRWLERKTGNSGFAQAYDLKSIAQPFYVHARHRHNQI